MKTVFTGLIASLAAVYGAEECTDCTATCGEDQTVQITIPYDRNAEILGLEYGSCNATSDGVRGTEQDSVTKDFEITLSMDDCGMGGTLRALEYDQTVANIRVGVKSNDMELEFTRYQFNTWCSYNDTYEIVFDYGTLTTDDQHFNQTGGEIGYKFSIAACDDDKCGNYTTESNQKGGSMIKLGIHTTSSHFDTDSKKFAPTGCAVKDTGNSLEYQLFGTDSNTTCTNDDVSFDIAYEPSNNHWIIDHILFLLGSYDSSTFQLVCSVVVCDYDQADSRCNDVATNCGTSY